MRSIVLSHVVVGATACGDSASDGAGGEGTTANASAMTAQAGSTTAAPTAAAMTVASTTAVASSSSGGSTCIAARAEALAPVDMVSDGEVTVLEEAGGVATIFVDADAGGINMQQNNPWVYVSLSGRSRVDVTDVSADGSTGWDVAFKRPLVRANVGDGGLVGQGGSFRLMKAFDEVTAADLAGVAFENELWFDDQCVLQTDQTGAIATSFDGWYDYEDMVVTPGDGTWLLRSGDGTRYFKVSLESYYSTPDGGEGMAGGHYRARVVELLP